MTTVEIEILSQYHVIKSTKNNISVSQYLPELLPCTQQSVEMSETPNGHFAEIFNPLRREMMEPNVIVFSPHYPSSHIHDP